MRSEQTGDLGRYVRCLPWEIKLRILHFVTRMSDDCVFSYFPQDWPVCTHVDDGCSYTRSDICRITRTFRMDTYTVPAEGRGRISTSFDHTDGKMSHIYLPSRDITHYDDLAAVQSDAEYELWKLAHQDNARVVRQEFHHLNRRLDDPNLTPAITHAHLLRNSWAAMNLPFYDDSERAQALQEKSEKGGGAQPFQMIKHLVFSADTEQTLATSHDFVHTPQWFNSVARTNEARLQARLDFEQCCGLFLRWDMMPQLETLCVDLRAYSEGFVEKEVLELAADEMKKSGLQLKLLALVGLRSGDLYPGHGELRIEEVEDIDEQGEFDPSVDDVRPQPNWMRLFRGAVRPGGELILVDFQAAVRERLPQLYVKHSSGEEAIFWAGHPNPWAQYESPIEPPPKFPNAPQDDLFPEDATRFPPGSYADFDYSQCPSEWEDVDWEGSFWW